MKKCKLFILVLMMCFGCSALCYASRTKVKDDPGRIWLSPLGSGDIKNNAYNRCRLIRIMKPGAGKSSKTEKNTYDVMAQYISDLYAQSIKISAYIAKEKEDSKTSQPDLSEEKAIIEHEITRRLADIAMRINVINSFEAGTTAVTALWKMRGLQPTIYSEFRAIENGKYTYVTDCEVLKK